MEGQLILHDCGLSLMGFAGFIVLLFFLVPETDEFFNNALRDLRDYVHRHK